MRTFGSLMFFIAMIMFMSCNNDDTIDQDRITNKYRVKSMSGINNIWGDFQLTFLYKDDGRLDKAYRMKINTQTGVNDTVGVFTVRYDNDYHLFQVIDYVLNIAPDSVETLKAQYPETYQDTVKRHRISQILYSVELKEGKIIKKTNKPRREIGSGSKFNPNYLKHSSQTFMIEYKDNNQVKVARFYDDNYGSGGENNVYTRQVRKVECFYQDDILNEITEYYPDAFNPQSWSVSKKYQLNLFSNILVGIDSDEYKMRRSSNKVVVAEPGVTTTYTLNEEGLATRVENNIGEVANVQYEHGHGNFSTLYATPLDKLMGCVWIL